MQSLRQDRKEFVTPKGKHVKVKVYQIKPRKMSCSCRGTGSKATELATRQIIA